MTLHQAEAFALVAVMLALFMHGRLRFDLVAALVLLAAVLLGVVPNAKAFHGFASPVIIIIASVLVVSRAIAASSVIERVAGALLKRVRSTSLQVGVLAAAVAYLSAFIKNVGTLGIFIPIAIQTAQRSGRSRSIYLMPLAFASLVGGTITKIGTSPNLLISSVREELGQPPFGLFDFAAVGLPLTTIAVVFLAFAWRLLPNREGQRTAEESFSIASYLTELRVVAGKVAERTVGDFEALSDGTVSVAAIVREGGRRYVPAEGWRLYPGDVLIVIGDTTAVQKVVAATGYEIVGADALAVPHEPSEEMQVIEAIVTAESALVGETPASLGLRHRYGMNLFAVQHGRERARSRLRSHRFEIGDVVLVQGWEKNLAAAVGELGLLPLADRKLSIGAARNGLVPIGLLAAALLLAGIGVITVEVAFFGAAVLTVLLRQVSLKEAYHAIEWPVIVMLGCLIPVGEALKDTGAATLVADALGAGARHLPGSATIGLILLVSMLLTPFLHHAAAVVVLGPVAAAVATSLGLRSEPFLIAVALGCACDFLTPIGHQNNTLVMGPGGYRFGDYWKLGAPLTLMVLFIGTPLIVAAWPLR
ncbi:MAG TPA: SLC13 family permease [Caldimonas sp.]|jgi:di/tricarboxylate transporter|nr:SLC13 family permease [Caldimonas sp.]HEX4236040.1 SLC13 family permease [Caldimonas sp.]